MGKDEQYSICGRHLEALSCTTQVKWRTIINDSRCAILFKPAELFSAETMGRSISAEAENARGENATLRISAVDGALLPPGVSAISISWSRVHATAHYIPRRSL